ncbi:M23 family metallopeptidase [Leucobacter luti]|uniref:Peptidase M23-like protein n=1 Tax=Leucobacter luti TaxID=340320 RepID=A0A4Q7U0T6_9MICO|nr:peptidoglycan DD-metalloendopeptidase family protein [Leucobacter luti]MBL3698982.1 M23 family peptidase [Leucobacter luti]RZT66360.1 peptidase M23-like protein [Leucobacter luti]
MSAPAALACAAAAVVIGLPVVAAAAQLEARHTAAAAADAAALAAADAAAGWIDAEPCAVAGEVATAHGGTLVSCAVDASSGAARLRVASAAPIRAEGRARAGPEPLPAPGAGAATGWVWPAATRTVSQEFHDGLAIDLDVPSGSALASPNAGVVVFAGPDGGGIPAPCQANPGWWRGPNVSVVIRHLVDGVAIYSSHNHVAPGSPESLGVRVGTPVAAGQQVARAGMSGCTSGPHTHFTMSSTPTNAFPDLNPFDYLGQP